MSPARNHKQLVDDRAQVELFGGQSREAITKIEAHLVPEDAQRPGAGAVVLGGSVLQDMIEKIEILLHFRSVPCATHSPDDVHPFPLDLENQFCELAHRSTAPGRSADEVARRHRLQARRRPGRP